MRAFIYKFSLLTLFFITSTASAQYTETINSNRPGESQGAFSVGNNVLQLESGFDFGNDNHVLLNTDTNIFGVNAVIRYGLLFEQLEINVNIRYQRDEISFLSGSSNTAIRAGLETTQIGAKYLIYDPYKNPKDGVNLYSYHANNKFKWSTLIPAVSVYAGAVFDFTNSEFNEIRDDGVSPNLALITQHNWGRWVWVNNIIFDRVGTNFPSTAWITTLTHSLSSKVALFGEYQAVSGDLYTDFLFRGGGAYLITKNLQVDLSGLVNLKNTPSRWNVGAGVSYRLDFHKKDEIIEDTSDKDKSSSKKQAERVNKKNKKSKSKRRDSVTPDNGEGDGNQ